MVLGVIRLLLSISVVITHSGYIFGYKLVEPYAAVQAFYIISGFYMALILNEKYVGKGSFKLFMSNRLLRLLPSYYVVLILSVFAAIAVFLVYGNWGRWELLKSYFLYSGQVSIGSHIIMLLSQITLFGQDTMVFLGLHNGSLGFVLNQADSIPVTVSSFMILPQAWSIGVELMFYLVAPFIVRRGLKSLLCIAFLSALLGWILNYHYNLEYAFWNYRFFPTQLVYFVGGIVSYKTYNYLKTKQIDGYTIAIGVTFLMMFTLFYQYIPLEVYVKKAIYHITVVATIPFAFMITQNSNIDKTLGELSYPMYMSHVLIITLISNTILYNKTIMGISSVALTMIAAFILVKYVEEPMYKVRQNRINSTIKDKFRVLKKSRINSVSK